MTETTKLAILHRMNSLLMQITIEVPDRIGEQLQQLGDCLPKAVDLARIQKL